MAQKIRTKPVIWHTPSLSANTLKNFACLMLMLRTAGIAIVEKGLLRTGDYTPQQFSALLASDSHKMALAGIGSILQLLGGLAVPIFSFLLVEGFLHTSDYRRYLLSVLTFAIFSELPYDLANTLRLWDISRQNPLFSLFTGLLMLYFLRMLREKMDISPLAGKLLIILVIFSAALWTVFLRSECGICIILLTAIFYLFQAFPLLKTTLGILTSLLYAPAPLSFYGIWCYNEMRTDRIPKYAYYCFYPLHLLLAGLLAKIIS